MLENKKAKINLNYKPTDKEEQLRRHVYKRKYEMLQSQERQRAERMWQAGEKAWDNIREEKPEWQSNYKVPLTQSTIESIIAEQNEQASRPFILPNGEEDKPRAKVMQKTFEYTMEVADHDSEMENIYRGGLIHGTSIGQEYYLKDKRMVRDIKGLSKASTKSNRKRKEYWGEEREVEEYDDVMMEWVHPSDILVDEKAVEFNRGMTKARDVIRQYSMHYDDAKNFFSGPVWNHLNNFRFVKKGMSPDFYQYYQPDSEDNSEDVNVLWYWARVPEDLLVVTINDVVVRMGPNIYKHKWLPFCKGTDIKRLGKFYGKGEPEVLESIQDEVTTLRRMMIDRHHLDIDKMFIGSPDLSLDEDELGARPHGLIPGSPNDIQAVEYNDIPLSVQATLRAINEDKVMSTGVDDRFQSVTRTPSTATEAAILKESTLKRIRMKLRSYERGFLVDMGRMRCSNIIQFYSQPKLEKIVGEKGTQDFKKEIATLARRGLLTVKDGQMYKKQYRQIAMEDKALEFDARGNIIERNKKGINFFELKPEYFVPVSRGGYRVKFMAGPSMPVSKPLMRQQMTEMFDRIMPIASSGETAYSMEKLADSLVKANELNPDDFKDDQILDEQAVEQDRTQMAIEIASQENQMVMEGKEIPELGTPYATPIHTRVHIEFVKSEAASQMTDEQLEKLLIHLQGEIMAIDQRSMGQMGTTQPGMENPPTQAPGSSMTGVGQGGQAMTPAMIEGGNQVPTGRALGNG